MLPSEHVTDDDQYKLTNAVMEIYVFEKNCTYSPQRESEWNITRLSRTKVFSSVEDSIEQA